MEEFWSMRGVNLLQDLTQVEVDDVLRLAPPRSYRKGEYVFYAGDPADALYILELGAVKVSYSNLNGDQKVLNVFRPGDIFGELFLGKYRHRVGEAQALEDVVVCRLTEDVFLSLIQHIPRIGLNFIRHLADSQREALARSHALMRAEAKYRLAGILVSMARRYCCTDAEWFELPASLTQEDLANMAALNRSTVSTLINELRREGVLGGTGRGLTVNRAAIEALLEDAGLEVLE